jgi:hypothetical protein
MSIVFLAVLAAVATQWAGRNSSRVLTNLNNATLSQAQASDKWSYFQAASMKEKLYEMASVDSTTGLKKEDIEKSLAKYRGQKESLMKEAKELEESREKFRADAANAGAHGSRMGDVVALFQISIALGSICLVTKKKPLWFISVALGAVAALDMVWIIKFIP